MRDGAASSFVSHRGAVTVADLGEESPWARWAVAHFGDPSGEQWALEAGRGLVDRPDLAVVAVRGADRQRWLTSLTSQVVTGIGDESRELLLLDPQGHVEHAAGVRDDGEVTWLLTEASHAPALVEWLDSMRFALRVEVESCEDLAILGTVRPRAASAAPSSSIAEGGAPAGTLVTWEDPWPGVTEGGTEYHTGRHPGERLQFLLHVVPVDAVARAGEEWVARERHRLVGVHAWEALRVAAWRPRVGVDTDERTIPAELDWLRTAVHVNKGCYRGQESVARVLNLGRPPRRLTLLQLDGSRGDLPERGAAVRRGERQVGVVTSVVRHADEGPIALALLTRGTPADAVLDVDGLAAAQELIVPVEGRATASPEQRPGAGLANPALRRPDMRANSSGGLAPASSPAARPADPEARR